MNHEDDSPWMTRLREAARDRSAESLRAARDLLADAWQRSHRVVLDAASREERARSIAWSLQHRAAFEQVAAAEARRPHRLARDPVIDLLFAIGAGLPFPARERVLDMASRQLRTLTGADRLWKKTQLAPLSAEPRRGELLREIDAEIAALPATSGRFQAAADRLETVPEDAGALVRQAIGWLPSNARPSEDSRGFFSRIPDSDWAALPADEARSAVQKWQSNASSFWERTAPLRRTRLPGWLREETEQTLLREADAKPASDRLAALVHLVPCTEGTARTALSRMLLSTTALVLRENRGAVQLWAAHATLEELRHLQAELLPIAADWDDDALEALSQRAAALGEIDLARSFLAAIGDEENRRYGQIVIALRTGPFESAIPLLQPYLDEVEPSGDLPWVAEVLHNSRDTAQYAEDAARFAEVVGGAACTSNRLSAWAAVFPALTEAARQALSPRVSAAVRDALREPAESSDDSVLEMLPWLSDDDLLAFWMTRGDPAAWQPTGAETTRLFSYDRGYLHADLLAAVVERLGGEDALLAWAQAADELDAWFSEIIQTNG